MELSTANGNNGRTFTPPPAGMHEAVCYRFVDLGTQKVEFQGEVKHQRKIMLSFELYETQDEFQDAEGNTVTAPFTMHQRFTWSMHEKGNLRPFLEAWRGRSFTDADLAVGGFNAKNLIGAPAYLNVIHVERDGKTFANISSINPLPEKMYGSMPTGFSEEAKEARLIALHNRAAYLALDPKLFDQAVFDALSDKIKATIQASPEYRIAAGIEDETPQRTDPADNGFDDAIPF